MSEEELISHNFAVGFSGFSDHKSLEQGIIKKASERVRDNNRGVISVGDIKLLGLAVPNFTNNFTTDEILFLQLNKVVFGGYEISFREFVIPGEAVIGRKQYVVVRSL